MATSVTSTYGTDAYARLTAAAQKKGQSPEAFQHDATMLASPIVDTSKWRDHMGLSVTGPKVADIPIILQYGAYVRAGWEDCWGMPGPFVTEAKRQGLKIVACLQPCNPNRYLGWTLTRMAQFAQWCVMIADLGVDVIEVGNEMNNPTFNAARDPKQTTAALLTAIVADAVHKVHPKIRVISNGWSPKNEPLYYPQVSMASMLSTAETLGLTLTSRVQGCGYHPYEMQQLPSWQPPANQPGWNACWWMKDAAATMKAHGVAGPICPTEYGKIGVGSDQAAWTSDYLRTFELYRTLGVDIDLMMWHTLRDGQSTLPGEGPMGVIDPLSIEKPSGAVLKQWGAKPWSLP